MNNMLEHSRLQAVGSLGQHIWLDQMDQDLLSSGRLQQLIQQDGVRGLRTDAVLSTQQDALIPKLQRACDLFAPLYRDSATGHGGQAGLVSCALSPRLAHDCDATVAEARRLWALIARPNAMLAIPATPAGIAALEQLIYAGININMTLIFAASQIQAVRAAHRRGLARRLQDKLSVQAIASVASIGISRIDGAVDALLPPGDALRGRAAIAAARIAYAEAQQDSGFGVFAAFGATPQRLLWSGSAASGAGRALHYVEQLIGADTIVAMSEATLAAFRAGGVAETTLSSEVAAQRAVLALLAHQGIDLETIGRQLLAAALLQFEQSFSKLLALST